MRTWVAPSSIAIGKSFDMPIERIGERDATVWSPADHPADRGGGGTRRGQPPCRATLRGNRHQSLHMKRRVQFSTTYPKRSDTLKLTHPASTHPPPYSPPAARRWRHPAAPSRVASASARSVRLSDWTDGKRPTTSRTLFVWRLPIMCSRTSEARGGETLLRPNFATASCTRFSAMSCTPAAISASAVARSTLFVTPIRVTSAACRPARLHAAAISSRTRATFAPHNCLNGHHLIPPS